MRQRSILEIRSFLEKGVEAPPGLFRWSGELPQEPFSPGKEKRRNKKGSPGSVGGGRLTSLVGVEYAGYGNSDYDL